MATENIPRLENIEPGIIDIKQHVRAINRNDTQEPITADVEFYLRDRTLHVIQAAFGRYAVFATGDLAFSYTNERKQTLYGILLKEGKHYYVSTSAHTAL